MRVEQLHEMRRIDGVGVGAQALEWRLAFGVAADGPHSGPAFCARL